MARDRAQEIIGRFGFARAVDLGLVNLKETFPTATRAGVGRATATKKGLSFLRRGVIFVER